jgi:hypothetical protein
VRRLTPSAGASSPQANRGSSEQLNPDAIDNVAAKSREWAHALLVNSCVATKTLQDKTREWAEAVAANSSVATRSLTSHAAAVAQQLKEHLASLKTQSTDATPRSS